MIECLPEAGFGRSIDLRYTETVGQRGRQRVTEVNRQKGLARLFSKRIRRGKAPSRNFLPFSPNFFLSSGSFLNFNMVSSNSSVFSGSTTTPHFAF